MMRLRDFGKISRWMRAQFTIETRRVEDPSSVRRVEVDGIISAELNLGLHFCNDRVHVTHIPSGLRVASFSTLGAALAFVHLVEDASITDWDEKMPTISPEKARELTELADGIEKDAPRPKEVVS
jgi:hypothetical protein